MSCVLLFLIIIIIIAYTYLLLLLPYNEWTEALNTMTVEPPTTRTNMPTILVTGRTATQNSPFLP